MHTLIEAISRRYPTIDDGAIALLDPKRVHRGAFAPNPKNLGLHGSDLYDFLRRWQDKLVDWMGEGETDPDKVTYRRVPDTADSAAAKIETLMTSFSAKKEMVARATANASPIPSSGTIAVTTDR